MPLEIYQKNEPAAIRTALRSMATIPLKPRQAIPKTGGLEDSLGGAIRILTPQSSITDRHRRGDNEHPPVTKATP